jgi:hypothetical protein
VVPDLEAVITFGSHVVEERKYEIIVAFGNQNINLACELSDQFA